MIKIRTLALSAVAAAGLTIPAMAADAQTFNSGNAAEESAILDSAANSHQARLLLMHQGYTHVSTLRSDAPGRYVGSAMKNGKISRVAVLLPRPTNTQPPTID